MKSVCVFLGSNPGNKPDYVQAARDLGREIARRSMRLVYGGSAVGCMKELANAALEAGGKVCGVIPKSLKDKEIAHTGLSELVVTGSMHERKAKMAELSDGFIALPGGLGTFEEIFEVTTWAQLGFHQKPVAFLNIADYYTPLRSFLNHAADQGFVKPQHRDIILCRSDIAALLDEMTDYKPTYVSKWGEKVEEL